jgi:hypothetical protein
MSKFYQLQPDEWLEVCKELKPAELKVLYRLRTLDPFGQHPIKFRVVDIAQALNMNKGTVSRAVQRLAELEYINLEIVEAIATLTTKSKRLSTDNLVVSTQPDSKNDQLSTDNLVVSTQLGCLQTTSAIATQPDTSQTSSGQGSVFSKISLDRSIRSDRSSDFDFSENSEQLPKHLEAIASCCDEVLENDDLNPVDEVEDTKSPKKATNPVEGDSPRRKLEDFILKSLQSAPKNRAAYFAKFTTADWEKWEAKFNPPISPPIPQRDPVAKDPWRVENAIASMVRCRDFEAAEIRLANIEKTNPVLAAQLREKYLCN